MTDNDPLPGVPRPTVSVGAASHRGKTRGENQDRISRFRVPLGEVFLVVDGMGGHEDGARAAELVVHGFEEHLRGVPADAAPEEALREAAGRTNAELHALSAASESQKMGATAVLLLVRGRRAVVAHAGDSRAYLERDGALTRWTRDHTRVQQMLDHDVLTEEEARRHPDASVVTRAFGPEPEIDLEVSETRELLPDDRVLLCSDGLCGFVDDAVIAQALAAANDVQDATRRLIELALAAGGEDNVSVQVVRVEERTQRTPAAERRRRRDRRPVPPAPSAAEEPRPSAAPPPAAPSPSKVSRRRLGIVLGAAALAAVLVLALVWSFGRGASEGSAGAESEETTVPTGETS